MQEQVYNQTHINNSSFSTAPNPAPLGKTQLRVMTDADVVAEYKRFVGTDTGKTALEELFQRHGNSLSRVAAKFYAMYPSVGTKEDFEQEAYLSAITAYRRYSGEKAAESRSAVLTYVYSTVMKMIQKGIDERGGNFRIHPKMVGIRNWVQGKMDDNPTRKRNFEISMGWDTPDKVEKFRKRYAALAMPILSFDDVTTTHEGDSGTADKLLFEVKAMTANDTLSNVEQSVERKTLIEDFEQRLTEQQRDIWRMYYYEDYTRGQIAEAMGIESTVVRNEIRIASRVADKYRVEVESKA